MNYNIHFDIAKNRKKFFWLSGLITGIGILALILFQLNLGVDFKSGSSLSIYLGKPYNEQEVAAVFKQVGVTYDTSRPGGNNNDMALVRFKETLADTQTAQIRDAFTAKYGKQVSMEESVVNPTISREFAVKAMQSIAWASLGIIIYVAIRFEYRFAAAAIIALLHDVFIIISVFSIFRFEVNLPFVAAVLTIVGYSINDTIVIFDRIRENLRTAKIKTVEDLSNMVNESIWQTMTRSINTVLTVVFTAASLFLFGSESIRLFSFALLVGLVSGGYSSIFIASPIWMLWRSRSLKQRPISASEK